MNNVTDLLKSPMVGNSTSIVSVGALIGVLALNPAMLPYATAEHKHEETVRIVTDVVGKAVQQNTTQIFIQLAMANIEDLERKIQFGLCLAPDCNYEKSELQSAIRRRQSLERIDNKISGGGTFSN